MGDAPTERVRGKAAWAPWSLVAIAIAFSLVVLRDQLATVSYPNDLALHLQMVTLAQHLLSGGQFPLDHWYPHLSTGSPFFVQYQSASAILTGAIGLIVGTQHAFTWSLYLLVALWPLCVYWSGRLLRWGVWEAAAAAAIAPLLFSVTGHGFEYQAYAWLGSGLWSMAFAMWSLPLAWGFSWRFISERRYLGGAVAALAATIAFHFLMAYLAGLIVIALVLLTPRDLPGRLARGALVSAGGILASLWVTIPLLADAKWTASNEFQVGTVINDSYGARKVLGWLVTGQLYDRGRFPIVTILVAAGLVACVIRFARDERARGLVVVWALSMVLFIGRPTFGFLINLLPGNDNLLLQRYLAGVQLAGLLLAGVGAVCVARLVVAAARHIDSDAAATWSRGSRGVVAGGVLAVVALVLALTPAWTEVQRYGAANGSWIQLQRTYDATDGRQLDALLSIADARGGGRIYAGLPSNWGLHFTVGSVPVYNFMEDRDVDAVGLTLRTSALMTGPEAWFDETNPGDYPVFGIHYLLLPFGHPPPVPAHLVARRDGYVLWSVESRGVVQVVDTQSTISADRTNLGARTSSFLRSDLPGRRLFPTIAFAGGVPATATLPSGVTPESPPGRVLDEHDALASGAASAKVVAERTAVVVLSASFDPGWTATVDGVAVKPEMVAPALVGVVVAPGVHTVAFEFRGYSYYPLLVVVSLAVILASALGPWALGRRGRRSRGNTRL